MNAAIFLVATAKGGEDNRHAVRAFCGERAGFTRTIDFRAGLSCVMAFGFAAWDRLFDGS